MMTLTDVNTALTNLTKAEQTAVTDGTQAFNRLKTQLQLMNLNVGAVVSAGVLSAAALSQFDVPVAFLPGAAQIAALQFDLMFPAGFSFVSATAGAVITNAQKSITSGAVTSGIRLIVFGLNQTTMAQGALMTIRLSTDATVAKHLYSLPMANISGSDPAGVATILSGISGSVTII